MLFNLPCTFMEHVVTASPALLIALHMYVPESISTTCRMSRATYPKSQMVLNR